MTVVEKNDDPLRQPPGFVKHGTPYGGSVTLSFGLGDHDVMVGLIAFTVAIGPLIGLVNTTPLPRTKLSLWHWHLGTNFRIARDSGTKPQQALITEHILSQEPVDC
jgi:hypothetical protein